MPRKLIAFLFAAAVAVSAAAQAPATATSTPAATSTIVTDADSHETREAFDSVLRRYPTEVSRVLKLDPSLMSNQSYLANYPALASFLGSPMEEFELRAEDLRRAGQALGRITGAVGVEEVLGEIFGRFCIGK